MVDYPGMLSAVMFTTGCNFSCGFCHNATLMGRRREGLAWHELDEACGTFREQWVKAVTISGGEPTLWEDDLFKLVKFFAERGFKVKIDTNGSRPDVLSLVLPLVDCVAMDIKCSLASYPDFVGFSDIARIAESVALLKAECRNHEFRTTVIESFHSDEEMLAIRDLVMGARTYSLQPFLPRDDLPGEKFRHMRRTSPERMEELRQLMTGCADTVEVRGG